ncbi:MAG: hypothetical protein AAGF71_14595 [Pseudomonadota bacterium]
MSVVKWSLAVFLAFLLPCSAQESSTPVARDVVIAENKRATVIQVSLPLVTVYAAAAEGHGAELSHMLLRKWLSEPEKADLNAINHAMAGFGKMLNFSIREANSAAGDVELVAARARLREIDTSEYHEISFEEPTVLDIVIDAVYVGPPETTVTLDLANINLPLDHHLLTTVVDHRVSPPETRTWIGHLDAPLTLATPEKDTLRIQ